MELVLCSLEISLRPETHIGDLVQVGLIFHLHFVDFELSIRRDLQHGLLIFRLHKANAFPQMGNLFVLLVQGVLVLLPLPLNFLTMLVVNLLLEVAEPASVNLKLLLEVLVARRILKHPLRILIASRLELLVVLLGLQSQLLIELIFDLIFAAGKLLYLVVHHQLLACDLLFQFLDPFPFVIARRLFTYTGRVWILCCHQVVEERVSQVQRLVNL